MNKIVFAMLMTVICLSNCRTDGQDVLQGIFDVFSIKAQIDDNCFGTKFEESIISVLNSQDKSLTLTSLDLFTLSAEELVENCPQEFFLRIDSLIQKKINDQTILNNFIPKIKIALQQIIDLIKTPHLDPKSFGIQSGSIFYTFLKGEENIDQETCKDSKISLFNILKGIIKGLSKDENSNKCYDNVASHRELITKVVNESLNSFKTQQNPLKLFDITDYTVLMNIAGDCRLFQLVVAFVNIGLTPEFALKEKVEQIENELGIFSLEVMRNIYKEKDYEIGYNVGEFFKSIFDFYVD